MAAPSLAGMASEFCAIAGSGTFDAWIAAGGFLSITLGVAQAGSKLPSARTTAASSISVASEDNVLSYLSGV
jgi:hypothetical protein